MKESVKIRAPTIQLSKIVRKSCTQNKSHTALNTHQKGSFWIFFSEKELIYASRPNQGCGGLPNDRTPKLTFTRILEKCRTHVKRQSTLTTLVLHPGSPQWRDGAADHRIIKNQERELNLRWDVVSNTFSPVIQGMNVNKRNRTQAIKIFRSLNCICGSTD